MFKKSVAIITAFVLGIGFTFLVGCSTIKKKDKTLPGNVIEFGDSEHYFGHLELKSINFEGKKYHVFYALSNGRPALQVIPIEENPVD